LVQQYIKYVKKKKIILRDKNEGKMLRRFSRVRRLEKKIVLGSTFKVQR